MPRTELQGLRLTRSPLPATLHVRDLVGGGLVQQFQTAAGTFVRALPGVAVA